MLTTTKSKPDTVRQCFTDFVYCVEFQYDVMDLNLVLFASGLPGLRFSRGNGLIKLSLN